MEAAQEALEDDALILGILQGQMAIAQVQVLLLLEGVDDSDSDDPDDDALAPPRRRPRLNAHRSPHVARQRVDVRNHDDRWFRANLRMTRGSFDALCRLLQPYLQRQPSPTGTPSLDVPLQVAIAISRFANGRETYRVLSDVFGVGGSTCNEATARFAAAVCEHLYEAVVNARFTADKWAALANEYVRVHGWPACIGAVDGTHCEVGFRDPANFNRKGRKSYNVQAVCSASMYFLDVTEPVAGSVHDARVLRSSPLFSRFSAMHNYDFFLLADDGYPLRPWLLTKYDNPETPAQVHFNHVHVRTRVRVEQAFGLLKNRFRSLLVGLEHSNAVSAKLHIWTCFALHNICLACGDDGAYLDELPVDLHVPQPGPAAQADAGQSESSSDEDEDGAEPARRRGRPPNEDAVRAHRRREREARRAGRVVRDQVAQRLLLL